MNEVTETLLSWPLENRVFCSTSQTAKRYRPWSYSNPTEKSLWANSVDTKDDLFSSFSREERAEAMVLGSTGAHLLPRKGLWPRFGEWKAEQQSLSTQATHPPPRQTLARSSFPPGRKSNHQLCTGPAAEAPPVGWMEGGQGWEGEE